MNPFGIGIMGPSSDALVLGNAIKQTIEAAVLAEREACAKLCDGIERKKWEIVTQGGQLDGIMPRDCAAAIRARGE